MESSEQEISFLPMFKFTKSCHHPGQPWHRAARFRVPRSHTHHRKGHFDPAILHSFKNKSVVDYPTEVQRKGCGVALGINKEHKPHHQSVKQEHNSLKPQDTHTQKQPQHLSVSTLCLLQSQGRCSNYLWIRAIWNHAAAFLPIKPSNSPQNHQWHSS